MRNNSDKKGGLLSGKPHSSGGIKALVKDDNRPVELEGGEAIVNKRTMGSGKEFEFEGEEKTPCEIISDLNQLDGNGVPISCDHVEGSAKGEFDKGGKIVSHKEIYQKWKSLVNMGYAELKKFYASEEGMAAGLSADEAKSQGIDSGRESARWIMKMKQKNHSEWTPAMWKWAKKQISFISRMSGMKGDLYDEKGNKTRKHTSLLIWGHNPEKKSGSKFQKGGEVPPTTFDKIISHSSRFKPSETIYFDPPLVGKSGAKLVSYTWSYEWTMLPNREGELVDKRVSDWTQAEISADTGRDIVHKFGIEMPDGSFKSVSSESVLVLLGYVDRKELKSFPNLVTAAKTLAKQQMQLAILEAQEKEYNELFTHFEKAPKPDIIKDNNPQFTFLPLKERWENGDFNVFRMGDVSTRQDNYYDRSSNSYNKNTPLSPTYRDSLVRDWILARVNENGGKYPSGIHDLRSRVERQKRKIAEILKLQVQEFKDGGKVPTTPYPINDQGGYDYTGEAKATAKEVDLLSLPRNIDGTNCGNCIFVKKGFCANKAIMLPVTEKMCCALWDGAGTERSWDAPKPEIQEVPSKVEKFELNELGGFDYTGEAKEIAEKHDLITLPKAIAGTNCGNCGFYTPLAKGGFCFRHNIQLPVTPRMSCAYWANFGTEKSWGLFASGGNISKTPAPKKEQIAGSNTNKEGSAADKKSAKEITFSAKTEKAIENKVDAHNAKNKSKVTVDVAKAVVRRGMGAYSTSHRPTIKGGKPNSRVAWGLARLDAFLYKVKNGKSKSGNYNQDDDLIAELGLPKPSMKMGGVLPFKSTIIPNPKFTFEKGGEITGREAAEQLLASMSAEDMEMLKQAYTKLRNDSLLASQERLARLEADKIRLVQSVTVAQTWNDGTSHNYFRWDEASKKTRDVLDFAISHEKNVGLAISNGGDISAIEDKLGNKYQSVPNLSEIDTTKIMFEEETILQDPRPLYVPYINEPLFARKGYIVDAIRVTPDLYIYATNGFNDTAKAMAKLAVASQEVFTAEDVNGYVLVTLDQLVLITDYYFTKAKAEARLEVEKKNKRAEEHYDGLPEQRRQHWMDLNRYAELPVAVKKKVSQEVWDSLDLAGKEQYWKPIKTHGMPRLKSNLKEGQMWTSFALMYNTFLNPEAKATTVGLRRYSHPEVSAYWAVFKQMMDYKLIDISEARKFESESYAAGLETSFGDSNTDSALYNQYGLLVKRQSGDTISPSEIEQIKEAWQLLNTQFGKLIRQAKEFGLKISHAGLKHMYARKAIGIYWPKFKTIGVSNIYGEKPFTYIFAHEVAHWIDNLLGSEHGKRFLCDDYESAAGQIAMEFRRGMNQKSSSDYYNSTKECFARALEQHFAMSVDGDNASMITPIEGKVEEMLYVLNDNYVGRDTYHDKIKPLILAFFAKYRDFFVYDMKPMEETPAVIEPSPEIETPSEAVAEAKKALKGKRQALKAQEDEEEAIALAMQMELELIAIELELGL